MDPACHHWYHTTESRPRPSSIYTRASPGKALPTAAPRTTLHTRSPHRSRDRSRSRRQMPSVAPKALGRPCPNRTPPRPPPQHTFLLFSKKQPPRVTDKPEFPYIQHIFRLVAPIRTVVKWFVLLIRGSRRGHEKYILRIIECVCVKYFRKSKCNFRNFPQKQTCGILNDKKWPEKTSAKARICGIFLLSMSLADNADERSFTSKFRVSSSHDTDTHLYPAITTTATSATTFEIT